MANATGAALDATIYLALAFDIGYEIDLERAREALQAEKGTLPRRRRTPESIQYRPAPVRVAVPADGLDLPAGFAPGAPPRAELSLFDFGAASLMAAFPVHLDPDALLALAGELADLTPLTAAARLLLAPWLERIRPAVVDFNPAGLSEEFVIFRLGEVEPGWLEAHADWVARLVRLDPDPLGPGEVREATRLAISYATTDVVVLDWAAGLVADRECADTLQVLEFANVQLLEFRHIDDQLDDRLEAAYRLIHPDPGRRRSFFRHRNLAAVVRQVRELEIEATSLFERAENALKLIGDQYLARVFGLASARFHLNDWELSIRRKLDTVGDVYDLLVEQAGSRRAETLEITVVVLIAIEILLALLRH
jgi:hypothetical protein